MAGTEVDERPALTTAAAVTIRTATPADAAAITLIYNQGIEDRQATLETRLRTCREMAAWLAARSGRHPVLVATGPGGEVWGWASLNQFNPRPCYDGVADVSAYVRRDLRDRGLGSALIAALVKAAPPLGLHKLVLAALARNNQAKRLYARAGFREVGIYRRQGRLDGQWEDVVIMERLLV